MRRARVLILGAAGRDFHNFNVVFREDPSCRVVAFTAAQIPNIEGRTYPPELAGVLYPSGIPILPESEMERILREERIHQVVFAYSDVSHEEVMHKASLAVAYGADFRLLGTRATMLRSRRPVVSVCAVRTGCGKSAASRRVASILEEEGLRVAVVRHPMPYGDLARQAVQRFATTSDLDRHRCTVEEREEFEPHLASGNVVYAGVDYERILRQAESDADVILWDGGNNDTPFIAPDLEIVLLDPHRIGHERRYFPGEVNLLRADVLVIAKEDTANPGAVEDLRRAAARANPSALLIDAASPITIEDPTRIRGRRVLVVEDGPTTTHGGMGFGAGVIAAERHGAASLVDPRAFAAGSLQRTFSENPHLTRCLPAMGYGDAQLRELEETIRRVPCEVVVIATPIDLRRLIRIDQPTCRVSYEMQEIGEPTLRDALEGVIKSAAARAR